MVSSREDKLRRSFDPEAVYEVYKTKELLTLEQFDDLMEGAIRIRSLGIAGLDWQLIDQLLSVYRTIPLLDHFHALTAGLGLPFVGITRFYQTAIDRGLLPATVLNRTVFHHVPKEPIPIGKLMLQLGLITASEFQRALGIRDIIRDETGIEVAVGQVFRSLADVSVVDFFQALGIQVGISYESLDRSAPSIFERAMSR